MSKALFTVSKMSESSEPYQGRKGLRRTMARIGEQSRFAAQQTPGSEAHRLATQTLLLLQDSLHELKEARLLLGELARKGRR